MNTRRRQGLTVAPGGRWTFRMVGLSHLPQHRTGGPKTAYITLADGATLPVVCGDLMREGAEPAPVSLVPEGRLAVPLALLPWPAEVAVEGRQAAPVALYPAEESDADAIAAVGEVAALFARLFPDDPQAFSLVAVPGGVPVTFVRSAATGKEGYGLSFGDGGVTVESGDAAGCFHALVGLAQILRGARSRPELFAFPASGTIRDAPRFGWRGCHLDVSRQFYPLASVTRLIDIFAWNKLNVLQWHLTDDEGWRLEIKALPELVAIGSKRGAREKLVAQPGSAAETYGGAYTQDEARAVIAHAARLHIDVVPEIDIPGHSTAALAALPHLADPDEPADSYRSVQGYPNNALNPALPQTYAFLETVLGEVAELFPSPYIHVGGDEVADTSWLASPAAQELMKRQGLEGTAQLQAYFLRRAKDMLTARGKKLAAWDEVAEGGGVSAADTLVMAWRNPEKALELARLGYEVVITPGQAYYLDMVQDDAWMEPGTSWAGTVPPRKTYEFEAAGELPADLADKLRGVQACIWSENLISRQLFNHMVFPRLSAVAEAAWTPKAQKDWLRFAAISRLMPQL